MYALISAIAKVIAGDERWVNVAIGELPCKTIFRTYSKIYAVLSSPFLTQNVTLDLDTVRAQIGGQGITFNEFLTQNGNTPLVTLDTIPSLSLRYAKYADAFHAGYKMLPVNASVAIDSQLPLGEKKDLYLTRDNTDYLAFGKNCLINVNGFFHYMETDEKGIYVKEAMRSLVLSKQNHIGILSFKDLGNIECVPITDDMIYNVNGTAGFSRQLYLDLKRDLTNKSVMLVIAGYLHALDFTTFYRVSASRFAVDIGNLPLLERYFESKKYIDYSSLPLERTAKNPDQIDIQNFYGDGTLRKFFTLPQSFFVILDNPDLFIDRRYLETGKLPDTYLTEEEPIYPVVTGYGKHANYWYTMEDGRYRLTASNSKQDNFLFRSIKYKNALSVSSARVSTQLQESSRAYFLKLGVNAVWA